jgi:hypothetical protein
MEHQQPAAALNAPLIHNQSPSRQVYPIFAQGQPMTQPTEFTLALNQNDINTLSFALGKQPYEMVAALVAKMNQQLGAQVAAQAKASLPVHTNGAAEQPHA